MKISKKLLVFFLILPTLTIGFWQLHLIRKSKNPTQNKVVVQEFKSNLIINDGKTSLSFNVSQYIGKTALEATQANAKVTTSGSGVNAFVTAINERAADAKKHEFWELLINGKPAEVGAGSYPIKNGDLIEWHINKY